MPHFIYVGRDKHTAEFTEAEGWYIYDEFSTYGELSGSLFYDSEFPFISIEVQVMDYELFLRFKEDFIKICIDDLEYALGKIACICYWIPPNFNTAIKMSLPNENSLKVFEHDMKEEHEKWKRSLKAKAEGQEYS